MIPDAKNLASRDFSLLQNKNSQAIFLARKQKCFVTTLTKISLASENISVSQFTC